MGIAMPWILEICVGWGVGQGHTLARLISSGAGSSINAAGIYTTSTRHTAAAVTERLTPAYCPHDRPLVSYAPLPRGYPQPPLMPRNGRLLDAQGREVTLRGVSWPGFNSPTGGLEGLVAGGSDATTDFEALVHQIRLLGKLIGLHHVLNCFFCDLWRALLQHILMCPSPPCMSVCPCQLLAYLPGFNTVKLPYSFDQLKVCWECTAAALL
jgi:hypothetical protein